MTGNRELILISTYNLLYATHLLLASLNTEVLCCPGRAWGNHYRSPISPTTQMAPLKSMHQPGRKSKNDKSEGCSIDTPVLCAGALDVIRVLLNCVGVGLVGLQFIVLRWFVLCCVVLGYFGLCYCELCCVGVALCLVVVRVYPYFKLGIFLLKYLPHFFTSNPRLLFSITVLTLPLFLQLPCLMSPVSAPSLAHSSFTPPTSLIYFISLAFL